MIRSIFSGPRSRDVEIALLLGIAVVLPLFEAPKNILGVLYFAIWAINRWRARYWGGAWGPWDTLLAGSILLAVVGTPFAGIKAGEWHGLRDIVRTFLLLWCMFRAGYTQVQWVAVFVLLIAGTAVAAAVGAWNFIGSGREGLELHSVGHSNHSATYLCTIIGVGGALLAARWSTLGTLKKVLMLAVLAGLTVAAVATGSRAAVLCIPLIVILVAVLHMARSRKALAMVAGGLMVSGLVLVWAEPWVVRKHVRNVESQYVLAYRDLLWERAATAWRAYPVFGIGMDNFPRITTDHYRKWTTEQGRVFDPKRDYDGAHAHSLYFDVLAERGLVGILAMLAFFGSWGVTLLRRIPPEPEGHEALVWTAATTAIAATLFIGLVNSTFHNEQAAAAMMCLAAWLSLRRGSS